jgi:hypothetical protein
MVALIARRRSDEPDLECRSFTAEQLIGIDWLVCGARPTGTG